MLLVCCNSLQELHALSGIIKNSVIWIQEALWAGSVYMGPKQLMFLQYVAASDVIARPLFVFSTQCRRRGELFLVDLHVEQGKGSLQ